MKKIFAIWIFLTAVFFSEAQNVGIGNSLPRFPLTFAPTLGQKVSFWEDGNSTGANYGIGVQAGLLQIHAYSVADNIAFGFGSSSNFTERVRINGNGQMGIRTSNINTSGWGTTGTHSILEIHNPVTGANNQSMLVLSNIGSNSKVGGITWATTTISAENRIGFLGVTVEGDGGGRMAFSTKSPQNTLVERASFNSKGQFRIEGPQLAALGNGFSMGGFGHFGIDAPGIVNGRFIVTEEGMVGVNKANPTARLDVNGDMNVSGAMKFGNSEGAAGQQLVSRGSGQAPAWVSRPYLLIYTRSGNVDLSGSALCTDIPGISGQFFTLATPSLVSYQFNIPLYGNNGFLGPDSEAGIVIQIRNSAGAMVSQGNSEIFVKNLKSETFIVIGAGDLPSGTYSIVARIVRSASNVGNVTVNSGLFGNSFNCNDVQINPGQLIIQVLPK